LHCGTRPLKEHLFIQASVCGMRFSNRAETPHALTRLCVQRTKLDVRISANLSSFTCDLRSAFVARPGFASLPLRVG
jgi:hypothetical protein